MPLHRLGTCPDPTPLSLGFCQVEGEETPYQDPGTLKPQPQRKSLWNGTEALESHKASRPTQPLRGRGQATGHGMGLGKATVLTGGSWPGERLKVHQR